MTRDSMCPMCGSAEVKTVWLDEFFTLRFCRNCSLHWEEPRRSAVEGSLSYDAAYYEKNYFPLAEFLRAFFSAQLERLESYAPGRKLLDVGFGSGIFLQAALERDWEAAGIETSEAAFDVAQPALGNRAQLRLANLANPPWPPAEFDAVTFWDVLAHVAQPLEYLESARRLLRPGGIIVIKTPLRTDEFFTGMKVLPEKLRRSLVHWPTQLWHFSEKTLQHVCEELGFTILELQIVAEPAAHLVRFPSIWRHPRGFMYFVLYKVIHRLYPQQTCIVYARKNE